MLADEMRRMCELVRKANTGQFEQDSLSKGGRKGHPGFPMEGQRVESKEAWEVWVEEEADREWTLQVVNGFVSCTDYTSPNAHTRIDDLFVCVQKSFHHRSCLC